MPDMDEGRVRPRLQHAGRHLAGPDRQGPAPGRGGAARYARHLRATSAGPAPSWASSPPRAYTGDILVSLKPPGQRRPMEELFDALREELKARGPRARDRVRAAGAWTRSTTWRASSSPIEVKVFGPDFGDPPRAGRAKSARSSRRSQGVVDVNAHVYLGNPDIVVRPDSVQTARVGLTELDVESQLNAALYGQVASTVPEQDRMTKIRVRYPDRVRYDREHLGRLPISLATATAPPTAPAPGTPAAAGIGFVPLGQLATIRIVRSPNELWRENQQPVITVTAELDKRDLGSVNRELQSEARRRSSSRRATAGSWRGVTGRSRSRSPAC